MSLKQLFLGSPIKGEPLSTPTTKVTMPPNVTITFEEWFQGSWIHNLN